MKIQIISFKNGLSDKSRLESTNAIINNSSADILMFSGGTIGSVSDIEKLKELIENRRAEVIFELKDINSSMIDNCLYHIKKGVIKNLYTNQLFAQSPEIENNYQLADRFLHELETRRKIRVKGLSFLIIQCGEINILKNIQTKGNRVKFRLNEYPDLLDRFNAIIRETDVILNPIHTPMGNQGKMKKRREFLSNNNRYYFSASNTKKDSTDLELKSLQYAYYNGSEITESGQKVSMENYVYRVFDIDG